MVYEYIFLRTLPGFLCITKTQGKAQNTLALKRQEI